MALTDLPDWIDEQSRPPTVWFVKRLQANDTLATGSHQAGPYLPKEFLFAVFPGLADPTATNPRVEFDTYIDSQGGHRRVRAIWYNNELRGGTRNETRITGYGGAESDLLDPESTGAVAVLAFNLEEQPLPSCHAWVCRNDTESDLVEAAVGRVDPLKPIVWVSAGTPDPNRFRQINRHSLRSTQLNATIDDDPGMAPAIGPQMPTIETLVRRSSALQLLSGQSVDIRLLRRHETLLDLFDRAEDETYGNRVKSGFPDLRAMLELSDRVRRGRQSRSADALAFQLRDLLEEELLASEVNFSFRPALVSPRPPDFVFPSLAAYNDNGRRRSTVASLYVEQAVRDRWEPIAAENKGEVANVLTLQRGVSETQFEEMSAAGLTLIAPARLHDTYPGGIRGHIKSLESFLADVRHLNP